MLTQNSEIVAERDLQAGLEVLPYSLDRLCGCESAISLPQLGPKPSLRVDLQGARRSLGDQVHTQSDPKDFRTDL